MKLLLAISLLVGSFSAWAQEPEFIYLAPKNVPGLPQKVVSVLEAKKCLVPKWHYEFGGVAEGEFAVSGQKDIAVICTKNNKAKILIFWGGPNKCPSEIDSIGQYINTVDK